MQVWVWVGLVLGAVLALVAYQELRPRPEPPTATPPLPLGPPLAPEPTQPGLSEPAPRAPLFTVAEREFFATLRQAVGSRYVPLAKVELGLLAPQLPVDETWGRAADFVLLQPETLQPLLILQYDPGRGAWDGTVLGLLQRAGMPAVAVSGRVDWTPQSLAEMIADALTSPR